MLARQLGVQLFQEMLGAQCMAWLEDKVYSIREAATKTLAAVAHEFGDAWVKNLMEKVVQMSTNPHYLYRLSILWTLRELAKEVSQDTLCGQILPIVVQCAADRVANVKFNAAKVLDFISTLVDRSVVESVIKPCLDRLMEDEDFDVKFNAHNALLTCQGVMAGG